ncbi:MAG: hypothetical protein H7Z13_19385 [Ferruginibacter sp.]|nr:hypothetical protein [Ferruginibacter sp.]
MKRLVILICVIAIATCKIQAQVNAVKLSPGFKDNFHSFNTVQILNGSTTTSFAVNTVNGFQFGKLFCGFGAGFDYYYHVSVPLFIEARIDLLERKGKLQLFGNGGLNFPFSSQNKKLEFKTGEYKTGGLYGGGLDYLVPVKKEAVIIGLAFSNKQVIQMVDNSVWNPILNKVENIPIKDKYAFNRIAIRIGWMF